MRREGLHMAEIAAPRATGREFAEAIFALTKPGLTSMSAGTAAAGVVLASYGTPDVTRFLATLGGTWLVGASAGALNQLLERTYDARMKRTEQRPLPSGLVGSHTALAVGLGAGFAGLLILAAWTTGLAALLAVITLVTYLGLYTPLKRHTHLATAVGGIPGALPPVIGWVAVTGTFSMEAYLLFLVLFLWQMPHFLALAWMYRVDYQRGGYRLLPALDSTGGVTSRLVLLYVLLLLPATTALALAGIVGTAFLILMLPSSLWFVAEGVKFVRETSNLRARRVFFASLAFIPSFLVAIVLDRVFFL